MRSSVHEAGQAETPPTKFARGCRHWLLSLLVVTAVLWPLWQTQARFFYDWDNHLWFIGYVGEYFRQHHWFPECLNTVPAVGMPQPVFYGFLLYPVLGLLASFLGADLALRVGLLGLIAWEYYAVRKVCWKLVGRSWLAEGAPVLVLWSTYSLTNLYHRGALTEYAGVALLTAAASFLVLAALADSRRERLAAWWLALFSSGWVVGCHPTTALLGAPLLGLLLVGSLLTGSRLSHTDEGRGSPPRSGSTPKLMRSSYAWCEGALLILFVVAMLLMIAPWLQATGSFASNLGMSSKYHSLDYNGTRSQSWLEWFLPVVRSRESYGDGTPFLEAPLDVAFLPVVLLFLFGGGLVGWRARFSLNRRGRLGLALLLLGLLWALLFSLLAFVPAMGARLSFLAAPVQFSYRFVAHANLGLLLALLGVFALLSMQVPTASAGATEALRWRHCLSWALLLSVVMAAGVLVVKETQVWSMRRLEARELFAFQGSREDLILRGYPEAAADYAVVEQARRLKPEEVATLETLRFPVSSAGYDFGEVGPLNVEVCSERRVVVNSVRFPWVRLMKDGVPVEETWGARKDFRTALWLESGVHRLTFVWDPPASWRFLRALSFLVVGLGFLGACLAVRRLSA